MPQVSKPNDRTILVAGDVTIDWNIARVRAHLGSLTTYQYIWGSDIATRACSQPGGAALLTELLHAVCARGAYSSKYSYRVVGPTISPEILNNPTNNLHTRSYSIWSAQPRRVNEQEMVWRAVEFWGTDQGLQTVPLTRLEDLPEDPWGIVLDDANLGFRDLQAAWPDFLTDGSLKPSWILIKSVHPIASGRLWDWVLESYADCLVVVAVSDLRKGNLQIGYGLSWEQITGEIVHATTNHPALSKSSTVVVSLETAGAVVIDSQKGNWLIFDPFAQEGDWKRDYPGMGIGYTSCYVAALTREFMVASESPQLSDAVTRGVHAARTLHLTGYASGSEGTLVNLQFPMKEVSEALDAKTIPLVAIKLSNLTEGWTILSRHKSIDFKDLAAELVRSGTETALPDIPVERIGSWASVDRIEIETIRSVRNIIAEYMAQPDPVRPLSLAVFGPPGSGKSFAIRPGRLSQIEFNLSQFQTREELPAAFHRVRDCALRHDLPFVFWDEFDTPLHGNDLGWLKYFLVPMQDGEFYEGGIPHPLGPAIFVFAGGIHPTMTHFRDAAEVNPAAKGRDFLSRLRGFLNILGPDAREERDQAFILRRALLLRSLLLKKADQLLDKERKLRIDEGVLCAFLEIGQYRHGARSMESIIDMSALSGKLMFERSCLPAPHQLDLHVNAREFLEFVSGKVRSPKP